MAETMKVTFELEIHRTTGGGDDRPISVTISDKTSGCRILEVNFGLSEFMEILTGRGGIAAEGELYTSNPIGCTLQHKTEILLRPKSYKDDEEINNIVRPFEVDGWRAYRSDLSNHYRWIGVDKVSVSFNRFIRPDGSVWEVVP